MIKTRTGRPTRSRAAKRAAGPSRRRRTARTAPKPYDFAQTIRDWKRQVRFFHSIEDRLMADPELRDKYVAIVDERLVDSGLNEFELYRKVAARWPDRPTLIVAVDRNRSKAVVRSSRLLP